MSLFPSKIASDSFIHNDYNSFSLIIKIKIKEPSTIRKGKK